MESRDAAVPFRADWSALIGVASRPVKMFSSFPYRTELAKVGEKYLVRLSSGRFLSRFEFEGFLEFTFNRPHVTYVMKGPDGLLILSFAASDGTLTAKASADIPRERRLGKKLRFLAESSGTAVSKMAESYQVVVPMISGSPTEFRIRDLSPHLLAHTIRYARFNASVSNFRIIGENRKGRFTVVVENDVVRRMEYESDSESSIIEVEKRVLDVEGEDFEGINAGGGYVIKVIGSFRG